MDTADTQPPSRSARGRSPLRSVAAAVVLLPFVLSLGPRNRVQELPRQAGPDTGVVLQVVDVRDAGRLVRFLDAVWEKFGDEGLAPAVAPQRIPPGMARVPSEDRKRAFVRAVLPYVLAENEAILKDRRALLSVRERLEAGGRLSEMEVLHLLRLAREYRVDVGPEDLPAGAGEVVRELLRRVDVVPPALALAQAALESAWGSSRFVVEGNALFGQWVFSSTKGMAPRRRPEGANYAVAAFGGLDEAVRGYMRNLNTLWAYEALREVRASFRRRGLPLDPCRLAEGLLLYSTRREEYVTEVVQVIRHNRLERYDGLRLAPVPPEQVRRLLAVPPVVAGNGRPFPSDV